MDDWETATDLLHWICLKDLHEKSGLAASAVAVAVVAVEGKKKREPKALTADQLVKRKAECVGGMSTTEEMLEFSEDGLTFACNICSKGEVLKWHSLRG